jgi:hypothetical protein
MPKMGSPSSDAAPTSYFLQEAVYSAFAIDGNHSRSELFRHVQRWIPEHSIKMHFLPISVSTAAASELPM